MITRRSPVRYRFIGNVAFERGDLDGAEEWWTRSLELARDGDRATRG